MSFTKINAAGIGTTETVTLDGLTVINDGSFGGNVSVGGTLTYEDVTNIDSVGLITARAGVVVGSGITLSQDGDIFATGITTVSGNVKVGTGITLSPDGDVFSTGVTTATTFVGALTGNVTGNVTGNISGGTVAGSTGTFSSAVSGTKGTFSDSSDLDMSNSAAGQLVLGGNGYTGAIALNATGMNIYHNSSSRAIIFGINETEKLRIASDGTITQTTTHPQITLKDTSDRTVSLRSPSSTNLAALGTDSGHALIFYTNGYSNERLRITYDGDIEVKGESSSSPYPVRKLKWSNDSTTTNGFYITQDSDRNARIWHEQGLDIIFATNNTERLRIDSVGAITVGERSNIHSSNALARFGIDCHGRNVLSDPTNCSAYGLAFYNDPTTDQANGIGFFNDDGSTCGGYILHQDKGSGNLGDIVFGTSASSNSPTEALRITSSGDLSGRVNNPQLIGLLGAKTTTGTTDWNHSTNARSGNGHTLLLGTASNGMGGSNYYHVINFEYGQKDGDGNITQLAIPYNSSTIYSRYRYSGSWSSWVTQT